MKSLLKSKKGALPVPYIVALIIAIIVIAVLIYWFLIEYIGGNNQVTLALCQGKLRVYCSSWATCNYLDTCQPKDNTGNAADFYTLNPDCLPFKGQANGLPNGISPTILCK
jgi:hypothetical protein